MYNSCRLFFFRNAKVKVKPAEKLSVVEAEEWKEQEAEAAEPSGRSPELRTS